MKKFAHVRNSDNEILEVRKYDDSFSPSSVNHKFGAAFDVRIIPYQVDDDLVYDPAAQIQVKTLNVLQTKVKLVKSIRALTAEELAVIADDADRKAKMASIGGKVSVLRQWADDAESTTVTSGNAVATLQQVVNRLGKFFDNFADLIEGRRYDK